MIYFEFELKLTGKVVDPLYVLSSKPISMGTRFSQQVYISELDTMLFYQVHRVANGDEDRQV